MSEYSRQLLIISSLGEEEVVRDRLTEIGFLNIVVVDYPDSLSGLESASPDLVLLIKKTGISLVLAVKEIREHDELVPILVVLSDMEDGTDELFEAGASDYLYYVGAEKDCLSHVVKRNFGNFDPSSAHMEEENGRKLRRLHRDHRAGFRVQRSLLPDSPSEIKEIKFEHRLFPSFIMSGDFIDNFELLDGRVLFYMADVSGHGASGALITALLKGMSRRVKYELGGNFSAAEVLQWINFELLQCHLEPHVSMFLGIVDQNGCSLEYGNAGHFPGGILCFDGKAKFLKTGGQPLGLFTEPFFEETQVDLPENYSIVLFSDGVLEVLPQQTVEAKEEYLLSLVESFCCELNIDSMIGKLCDYTAECSPDEILDDLAVLTLTNIERPR